VKYELNDRDLWWEIKDTEAGYTHIAYPSELISDVLRAMGGEIRKINLSLAKAYTAKAFPVSVDAQKAAELSMSLCWAIESAGASDQLTKCSVLANELRALILKIVEKAETP